MTDDKGPFAPVFETNRSEVLIVLLIALACPIVYTVHKIRTALKQVKRGGDHG